MQRRTGDPARVAPDERLQVGAAGDALSFHALAQIPPVVLENDAHLAPPLARDSRRLKALLPGAPSLANRVGGKPGARDEWKRPDTAGGGKGMGTGAWKQESMMILPDTHTHTRWSDGVGEIEANVRRAAELGLPAIACTDHMALQSPPPGLARPEDAPPGRQTTWHMAWQDLPNYIAEVERARAACPGSSTVALEFDYWRASSL